MRFELCSPALAINSNNDGPFKYVIRFAKLWNKKIIPNASALLSLNKNLLNNNKSVEYIHERPVIKSFIFPRNHTTLVLDDIFHGVVPHKLHLFFIKQGNINGEFKKKRSVP